MTTQQIFGIEGPPKRTTANAQEGTGRMQQPTETIAREELTKGMMCGALVKPQYNVN